MARLRPPPGPMSYSPTAQTLLADVDVTPISSLETPGLGLATFAHLRPFQCMITVVVADPAVWVPTAQALPADTAVTPSRVGADAGLGIATRFQARPFHRKAIVF